MGQFIFTLCLPVLIHLAVASTPTLSPAQLDVAEFQSSSSQVRYQKLESLATTYKNTTDPETLKPLADFFLATTDFLTQEVLYEREEDWLPKYSRGIFHSIILRLAKYSEINATLLTTYYRQIQEADARGQVLLFWNEKLKTLQNEQKLIELLLFFKNAQEISLIDQDEDYIPRTAASAQSLITSKLAQMSPSFEGVYEIQLTCSGAEKDPQIPAYCQSNIIDRLTIIESHSDTGVQISLSSSENGLILSLFSSAQMVAQNLLTHKLEAMSKSQGVLSHVTLSIDAETGLLSGYLKSSDYLQTIRVQGKRLKSTFEVFSNQKSQTRKIPSISPPFSRPLKGVFDNNKGVSLHVVTIPTGGDTYQWGGSLLFDESSDMKYRFQDGAYYSELGILVLVGQNRDGSLIKLILGAQADQTGLTLWNGFLFSSLNGNVHKLELVTLE